MAFWDFPKMSKGARAWEPMFEIVNERLFYMIQLPCAKMESPSIAHDSAQYTYTSSEYDMQEKVYFCDFAS